MNTEFFVGVFIIVIEHFDFIILNDDERRIMNKKKFMRIQKIWRLDTHSQW